MYSTKITLHYCLAVASEWQQVHPLPPQSPPALAPPCVVDIHGTLVS